MSERTQTRTAPLLTLLTAVALVGLVAWTPHRLEPPEAPVVAERPDPERARRHAERAALLALIREHHRSWDRDRVRELAGAISEEATRAGLDPLLVASIVARESSFRPTVVSHRGAVGLMQLRPFVARDVAERTDVAWNGVETLHKPALNIRLGVRYYNEMVERFDGDTELALAAYNVGPTRLSRLLRQGTFNGSRYADEIISLYGRISARRDADQKPIT